MFRTVLSLAAAILLFSCVLLAFNTTFFWFMDWTATRWDEVPATIVSNEFEEFEISGHTYSSARVKFRYEYDGREYTIERLYQIDDDENKRAMLQHAQSTNSAIPCRIYPGTENGEILFSPCFPIRYTIIHDAVILALGLLGLVCARLGISTRGQHIVNGHIPTKHERTHTTLAVASAAASVYVALTLFFQISTVGLAQYPLWGFSRVLVPIAMLACALCFWMRKRKTDRAFRKT